MGTTPKLVVDAYDARAVRGRSAEGLSKRTVRCCPLKRLAKSRDERCCARCLTTLVIAPGDRAFRIVSLVSAGAAVDPRRWAELIDLSSQGRRATSRQACRTGALRTLHLARTVLGRIEF
jgi:hypothetical protein